MRFFYHYNKPLSQKRGKPTISLHFGKKCHYVDELDITIPTKSKINKDQPRFVMTGKATNIEIKNGKATIT